MPYLYHGNCLVVKIKKRKIYKSFSKLIPVAAQALAEEVEHVNFIFNIEPKIKMDQSQLL